MHETGAEEYSSASLLFKYRLTPMQNLKNKTALTNRKHFGELVQRLRTAAAGCHFTFMPALLCFVLSDNLQYKTCGAYFFIHQGWYVN